MSDCPVLVMLTCLFCKIINNINSTVQVNFKMSDNPQIAALYQISQVLLKAFQQINQITGNILNKQPGQSHKNTPKEEQKPKQNPPSQDKGKNKNDRKASETVQKSPVQEKSTQQVKKSSKKQQLQEKVATKKTQGEDKKKQQHPDKPKQPITPFFRFNAVIIEQIKKEYPDLNQQDLVKASGGIWQKLTPEQKKPYQQSFEKDKQVYAKALAKFFEKHPEEKKKN